MQDRYAGDAGDFIKLGLLRSLSPGKRLGVAWYRFPDEDHNTDGRHISYLQQSERYAALDPELFDHLRTVVSDARSIRSLLPVLNGAVSSDESLDVRRVLAKSRRGWRRKWFSRVLDTLAGCDLVFADPDNGIVDDSNHRKGRWQFSKQMPLEEVRMLARDRCAVIYHHNTRRRGGHDNEVTHWLEEIGLPGLAVRAPAYSPRTFFVLNPDEIIQERVRVFCQRWESMKVRLHPSSR